MKILYLAPHVPSKTKARSFYQIQGLRNAGHHVTVATLERVAGDRERLTALRDSGMPVIAARVTRAQAIFNSLWSALKGLPLQAGFVWSPALMKAIEERIRDEPPDVIHIEHLRMAQYGLRLRHARPVVWDAVDHLASLYEQTALLSADIAWRWIGRFEAPRLRRYESWLTGEFPATLTISRQDQGLFQAYNNHPDRVQIALLGLPITMLAEPTTRSSNTLIISGALNYQPNIASVLYFVREVWPLILAHRPDTTLQLVGTNPAPSIRALHSPRIEVTGFVPSLLGYVQRATVALAPIVYGSGTQIKVLEAFLTATPLVATSIAMRGLEVRHGEQVLIADTPESFAEATLQLLADPARQQKIGATGRRYVEQRHDLTKTTSTLLEIYSEVMANWHQARPTS